MRGGLMIAGSIPTKKRIFCVFPPLAAPSPAWRIFWISSSGTGSGFSRRMDRVVVMISNTSSILSSLLSASCHGCATGAGAATIDNDMRAGHVARKLGRKIQHHARHFLRQRVAAGGHGGAVGL